MREDKNVTRKRGRHFSSFDNVESKVRLCCILKKDEKKKERERERELRAQGSESSCG